MLARIFAGTRPTTSQEASLSITMLLDAPRKPRPASAAKPSPYAAAQAALTDVPVSFYAIPAGYVAAQQIDLNGNDYLFVRVRNMSRGGKRMSRVVGSPEAPRYMHMSPACTGRMPGVDITTATAIRMALAGIPQGRRNLFVIGCRVSCRVDISIRLYRVRRAVPNWPSARRVAGRCSTAPTHRGIPQRRARLRACRRACGWRASSRRRRSDRPPSFR